MPQTIIFNLLMMPLLKVIKWKWEALRKDLQ